MRFTDTIHFIHKPYEISSEINPFIEFIRAMKRTLIRRTFGTTRTTNTYNHFWTSKAKHTQTHRRIHTHTQEKRMPVNIIMSQRLRLGESCKGQYLMRGVIFFCVFVLSVWKCCCFLPFFFVRTASLVAFKLDICILLIRAHHLHLHRCVSKQMIESNERRFMFYLMAKWLWPSSHVNVFANIDKIIKDMHFAHTHTHIDTLMSMAFIFVLFV